MHHHFGNTSHFPQTAQPFIPLELGEETLIAIKRSNRHKVGEGFMMLIGSWDELWHHRAVLDSFDINTREERVFQNCSCRTFRDTKTSKPMEPPLKNIPLRLEIRVAYSAGSALRI